MKTHIPKWREGECAYTGHGPRAYSAPNEARRRATHTHA